MKWLVGVLLEMMLLSGLSVTAQGELVTVTMSAEYDIGFECPVASTLDETSTVLWVLMEPCLTPGHRLLGFKVADGTPVNSEGGDYVESLTDLEDAWITWWKNPFAFTAPDTVEIIYAEPENYDTRNLRLNLSSGETSSGDVVMDYATIEGLIPGFDQYPEETVYSLDHALAAVANISSYHIIDLTSGTEVLRIDLETETYATQLSFSADNQRIYLATYKNPDDYDDFSATLQILSLPDGDVLQSLDVPSAILTVSPDEQYATAEVGSSDSTTSTLFVVHLPSGSISEGLSLYEEPSKVMSCANRESDLSDVDFTNDGRLRLTGISWLPDSSGFVTSHSYRGIGAGGGAPCVFDHSRMRIYRVEGGG